MRQGNKNEKKNMGKNMIKKALILQNKIEAYIRGFHLSVKEYFLLLGVSTFGSGIMMLSFCSLSGYVEDDLVWNSSPTFWLVTGMVFLFCYLGERKYKLFEVKN